MTAEVTQSSDSLKHGFRVHHMFTAGQKKKKLQYQWDLHRLVRCKATHGGRQALHLPSLVSFSSRPNYIPYIKNLSRIYVVLNRNTNRVAQQVLTFGQQLEVVLQGLDTRPFDC